MRGLEQDDPTFSDLANNDGSNGIATTNPAGPFDQGQGSPIEDGFSEDGGGALGPIDFGGSGGDEAPFIQLDP